MSNRLRKKPHGKLAAICSSNGNASVSEQLLPDTKEAIEELVMSQVVASAARHGFAFPPHLATFCRTAESDFDFTLRTGGDPRYVELTEIAPLQAFGGTYSKVPVSHRQGSAADLIVAAVRRKASKYAPVARSKVHLLAYVTDFRLAFGVEVLRLAAHYLQRRPPGFASVLYFVPGSPSEASLTLLYPVTESKLDSAQERALRDVLVLGPDLSAAEVSADGKSIKFKVGWPPLGGA